MSSWITRCAPHSAGIHLLGLINQALDLSKIEAGKLEFSPESVSLTPLIDEVIGTARPLAEARRHRGSDLRMADRELAPERKSDSIHVRAGELHHLGPLLGVGRDGSAVVLRRAGQRDTAKAGDALLDLRIGHREVYLLVEQGDDLRRRSFRSAEAVPGVGQIARHRL